MHKLALATGLLLVLAAAAGAETRNLTGFDSVAAEGGFDTEISLGDAYSVDVSGPDAARVRTRVQNGDLKIEPTSWPWFGTPQLNATVRVTTPRLESVAAARGADVTVTGVRADDFSIAAAMGAQVSAAGECGALEVAASMGASVDAEELICRSADVAASMGASVSVFASQALDASASMGGSISVGGNPPQTDIASTMGGSVSTN